uniref:Uncharacterized protein n=1 Tax=Rousettus aegyptiacus TaxID=9407 RepID=A0A7J8B9I3_ROUAE|nr:hypothetical protein HJG63_009931 [Rousettus aegyptiacus]
MSDIAGCRTQVSCAPSPGELASYRVSLTRSLKCAPALPPPSEMHSVTCHQESRSKEHLSPWSARPGQVPPPSVQRGTAQTDLALLLLISSWYRGSSQSPLRSPLVLTACALGDDRVCMSHGGRQQRERF